MRRRTLLPSLAAPALVLGVAAASLRPLPSPSAPAQGDAIEAAAIDRAYSAALARAAGTAVATPLGPVHDDWSNPWAVKSEHYEVRTVKGRGYGLRMAQRLEEMLPLYQDFVGSEFVPGQPFVALIHPTIAIHNQFGNDHSDERSSIFGGFYAPESPDAAVAALYDLNPTLELFFLTHGAAQQFIDRAFPGVQHPAVLTQGIGAYFQTFWDYGYFVERYKALRDATSGRRLPALRRLMDEPISRYADGNADGRFVQLAMTFIYLRKVKEETRSEFDGALVTTVGPFDDYIRRAARGEDVSNHPVQTLLTTGAAELDAEMRAFEGW